MKILKRHLSVANVLSLMALFVALSASAYAATTIGKKSVKAQHLANNSVTSQKLRNGAVTTAKLRNGAVIGSKIAPGAVSGEDLANGGVRSAALGGGVVTSGKIKDGAVTPEKLANNSVGTDKITANAVATGKIQDGAISAAKLNSGLLAQLVKDVSYATASTGAPSNSVTKSVTALCPPGKQVVGGGAKADIGAGADPLSITESAPHVDTAGNRTGWSAAARHISGMDAWALEAYAICADL